jgi:hypothetical protein
MFLCRYITGVCPAKESSVPLRVTLSLLFHCFVPATRPIHPPLDGRLVADFTTHWTAVSDLSLTNHTILWKTYSMMFVDLQTSC